MSSTVDKDTFEELDELVIQLKEKNGQQTFVNRSSFLDRALESKKYTKLDYSAAKKKVPKEGVPFYLSEKHKENVTQFAKSIGKNRSVVVTAILKNELVRYKELMKILDSVIIGAHEGKYFVSLDALQESSLPFLTRKELGQCSPVFEIKKENIVFNTYQIFFEIMRKGL